MCRRELPPGPEKFFDEGCGLFFPVQRAVERPDGTWGRLTAAQQRAINEVIRLWQAAADQGHSKAQFNLGQMYQNGDGVTMDDKKAFEWYTKSAEQGYAGGQYSLGYMYRNSKGVTKDLKKAVECFTKAAEQKFQAAIDALKDLS